MKLKKPKRKILTPEIYLEVSRLLFGSLILILISSGFKLGLFTGCMIALILSVYLCFSAHVFDFLLKFGAFVYGKYLKDSFEGFKRAKNKIQGGAGE